MARIFFVLVSFFVFVQSAPLDHEKSLKRHERSPSCDPCEQKRHERPEGPPGPPPPPPMHMPPPPPPPPRRPVYRTHQWSGYSNHQDGSHQEVFSGAAASLNQGSNTHGEAYSIAAAGAAVGDDHKKNKGQNHVGYLDQESLNRESGHRESVGGDGFNGSGYQKSYGTQSLSQNEAGSGSRGSSSGHDELNGALDLASQGVDASRLNSGSGCDKCGKGSYAYSNAKSNSGTAVAVSVGG